MSGENFRKTFCWMTGRSCSAQEIRKVNMDSGEPFGNYLYQARGVDCSPEQIVIGAGSDYILILLSMILGKGTYYCIWKILHISRHIE